MGYGEMSGTGWRVGRVGCMIGGKKGGCMIDDDKKDVECRAH